MCMHEYIKVIAKITKTDRTLRKMHSQGKRNYTFNNWTTFCLPPASQIDTAAVTEHF